MNVKIIPARALTADQIELWKQIQNANEHLGHPMFSPEFTILTATVREDVYVGILRDDHPESNGKGKDPRIIGFFPFQRKGKNQAIPVGGVLSDYQGLIIPSDYVISPSSLLQKSHLKSWQIDHLITAQSDFSPYHESLARSPILNLSKGFEDYYQQRMAVKKKYFKEIERNRRKLERDIGPLRYQSHIADQDVFEQVLAWKSQKFTESGLFDIFSDPWTREVVSKIWTTQTDSFSGQLSGIYAGDELISAHLGMVSQRVWHYWLPGYNHRFKKFSPGMILLLEMAKDATSRGISALDLGKGNDVYKTYFSNDAIPLAEGYVTTTPRRRKALKVFQSTVLQSANFIRQTPLKAPAKLASQWWQQHQLLQAR